MSTWFLDSELSTCFCINLFKLGQCYFENEINYFKVIFVNVI